MRITVAAVALLLAGCGAAAPEVGGASPSAMTARDDYVACTEPRPEICTMEYVPVCALRATGIQCVTEPCDGAFERITRPNGCGACEDADVTGYVAGACGTDDVDSPLYLDP
jgi:hypothetical protein